MKGNDNSTLSTAPNFTINSEVTFDRLGWYSASLLMDCNWLLELSRYVKTIKNCQNLQINLRQDCIIYDRRSHIDWSESQLRIRLQNYRNALAVVCARVGGPTSEKGRTYYHWPFYIWAFHWLRGHILGAKLMIDPIIETPGIITGRSRRPQIPERPN